MSKLKYIIISLTIIAILAAIGVEYAITKKFTDTAKEQPLYAVRALDLIKEFQKNDGIANIKYAEKIISVTGVVTETEAAGTMVNVKLGDTVSGSYTIFAFQQKNLTEARNIKVGDTVAIKGSCSAGVYSEILETEFITFKRCTLNK